MPADQVPFFELADTFTILARGTCVTGHVTGLVHAGDSMRSGDQVTLIKGVEQHPVIGADTRTDRRPIGLLVEGDEGDYLRGTHWLITPKSDDAG